MDYTQDEARVTLAMICLGLGIPHPIWEVLNRHAELTLRALRAKANPYAAIQLVYCTHFDRSFMRSVVEVAERVPEAGSPFFA